MYICPSMSMMNLCWQLLHTYAEPSQTNRIPVLWESVFIPMILFCISYWISLIGEENLTILQLSRMLHFQGDHCVKTVWDRSKAHDPCSENCGFQRTASKVMWESSETVRAAQLVFLWVLWGFEGLPLLWTGQMSTW